MYRTIKTAAALGLSLLILHPAASAESVPGKKSEPAARLIVKFRKTPKKSVLPVDTAQRVTAMALQTGVGMQIARPLSGGAQLVSMDRPMTSAELTAIAQKLSSQPDIEYAEPDARLYLRLTPNDPLFARQYYLKPSAVAPGAINAPKAWDVTTGSEAIKVAVIDSGILFNHVDIKGRTLPGYDFIAEDPGGGFFHASDGDGRDDDPSDPGAAGACGPNEPPGLRRSIWHGTRIASLIGAVTNNGQGMAGVDWSARILPIRALSHCGGFVSDVNDAIRWAAGLPVPGVPGNPNPARIINLSSGSNGPATCMQSQQDAIDDVIAAGVLVVTAAGNSATNALRTTFTNCKGVLSIAATMPDGGLASTSSFGAGVGLSAPGVDILTAANRGNEAPIPNGDTYSPVDGTSLSAPLVAGVAALMLSLNSSLTPQQLIGTLRANARPFPLPIGGTRCSDPLCGAGLLNAAAAVQASMTGNISPAIDGGSGLRAAFASAAPLQLGGSRNGSLTEAFQFDVYRVTLPTNGKLTVVTTGSTDTYGYLFDASGKLLGQNADIDPMANVNFRIEAELAAGNYYVAVEGFNRNTTGDYTLNVNSAQSSGGGDSGNGDGGGGAAFGLLGIALFAWLLRVQWRDQRHCPGQ